SRMWNNHIRQTGIADDNIGGDAHPPCRGNDATTPVAKPVSVTRDRYGRADDDVIRCCEIGNAREVDIQHQDGRGRLREGVLQFVTDAKLHRAISPLLQDGPIKSDAWR